MIPKGGRRQVQLILLLGNKTKKKEAEKLFLLSGKDRCQFALLINGRRELRSDSRRLMANCQGL